MPAQIAFSILQSHIVLAMLHNYVQKKQKKKQKKKTKKHISLEHAGTHNSKL